MRHRPVSPLALFVLVALTGATRAQQPNLWSAYLDVNGEAYNWGATQYVEIPTTHPGLQVQIVGQPSTPYALAVAPRLELGAAATPFGLVDLPLEELAFVSPIHDLLDASGQRTRTWWFAPGTFAPGETFATQAFVFDATAATGASLTGAAEIAVYYREGGEMALSPLASQVVDLTPAGLEVAFYGIRYTTLYLNANGTITFGAPDFDFSPTQTEMLGGPPRIAAYWTDVDTSAPGARLVWEVNAASPCSAFWDTSPGSISVRYEGIRESGSTAVGDWAQVVMTDPAYLCSPWQQGGFSLRFNEDVDPFFPLHPPVASDVIVGASPGGNLSAQGPQTVIGWNMSTTGTPWEALYDVLAAGDPHPVAAFPGAVQGKWTYQNPDNLLQFQEIPGPAYELSIPQPAPVCGAAGAGCGQ